MQFVILNYVPREETTGAPAAPDMEVWHAYTKAMVDAGVMRGGNALQPSLRAATVRMRAGRPDVQDGPYADSKEELGGYFVIEAPDMDAALEWAARNPAAAYGAVEVRPVMGG